jgi:K+-transporting ATPase ATPase A chain
MVLGGVVQNFSPTDVVNQASGIHQSIPGGPVASQEAIKILGTNGGGYFNANSAHPFENPNAFISLFEVFLILLIPSALPYAFGRMVGDQKQGYTVAAVMGTLWLASTALMGWAVAGGQGTATAAAGGLGEGFEQRFGPVPSAIFATSTTLTSTGAINVAHDSLPPLAGGVAMVNMMLGEVAPGGTGSGLYGLLILSIISVFIAGLMVGRTPEYLGKKIGPTEMKLAAMYILVTPTLVLALAGITVLLPDAMANAPATGPHQFSEVLYAFTSGANNNGSAFGGISTSGPYLSVMMGLAMLLGRFLPIVLVLALAGSLARQGKIPASAGTVPTHGPLFGGLLLGVTVIMTALSYFPALALGPLAEGLLK